MKLNRKILALLTVTLLFSLPVMSHAQDETPASNSPDDNTNTLPTLKALMAESDEVTNTVGIVLVKISPKLWAGKYEVTQDAYQKVMGSNPSAFQGGNHPVDSVTWTNAMDFCKKLTGKEQAAKELPDDWIYNLPTQEQWERLMDNASLDDAVMSLDMKSLNIQRRSSTAPVGSLGPNSLGLYDMRGNVMEWCLDAHDPSYHVLRGVAWDTIDEPSTRLEFRWFAHVGDAPRNDFGFRVVLEPK